jgi:16S rRNA (cytidine1402-2'-O)-methyltransferase
VVATPIGNLEDVTLRGLRTLRECDAILAEDTRRTKALCRHHGVPTPLRAFHAHTPDAKVDELVDELRGGAHLALVTDAGTPLVSDPGARLVQRAADAGVKVEPIPGPSAPLAALSAAGLRVGPFRFVGFVPRSGGRRRRALDDVVVSRDATVLFEAANRLPALLRDLSRLAPDRPAAVCRELTKLHEEIARGTLAELSARYAEPPRGEVTVVVEGAPEDGEPAVDPAEARERARELLASGLRTKEAAKRLAAETGLSTREAYGLLLDLSSD